MRTEHFKEYATFDKNTHTKKNRYRVLLLSYQARETKVSYTFSLSRTVDSFLRTYKLQPRDAVFRSRFMCGLSLQNKSRGCRT